MQQIFKKLLNNGIDSDSAEFLVPPNSFISGYNVRIGGTTDLGGVGYIESILENVEKFHVLSSGGNDTRIGFAASDEEGWIVKFNYNDAGNHGIFLYSLYLETWYDLLLEADVTGGLGFQKNELIHSARIENGILYWCNSETSEPRKLNIRSAVNLYTPGVYPENYTYTSPISQNVLYWIRRQPGLPPSQEKQTDSPGLNNFTKNEGFWFSYRYIYRDYEISTLSGLSTLANYNTEDEGYNYIHVEIPILEQIEQDVLQVDLVVKYANSGKLFVIKSWNKNIPADAALIVAHNDGSANLYFDYANDFTGIALDDAYSVKPYDSVPIYAQTIEIARNRSFMMNYTIGYDTPITTSLNATFQTQTEGATATGTFWQIQWRPSPFGSPDLYYVVDIQNIGVYSGYYGVLPYPGPYGPAAVPPILPTTLDYPTELVFIGDSYSAILLYFSFNPGDVIGFVQTIYTTDITNPPTVISLVGSTAFKSDASYQPAVVFYDHAGRKCGVFTRDDLIITTPDRDYDTITYTTAMNWTLDNTLAVNEIPEWAYYYSVVVTKCLRTRFFLEAKVKNLTYATKDEDGLYIFDTASYSAELNGIAVDITMLNSYGMGYTFADGDFIKLYIDGAAVVHTLSIVAQQGNFVVCELKDIGAIGNDATPFLTCLFEIYTPYRPSTDEPFYEVAQTFAINNPTESGREYSTLAGSIRGDITLLNRSDGSVDYLTENMSPNDKYPYRWNTDSGRPNFIDDIGQEVKTNEIAYSDVLIQGTRTNGLSTFEALNTKDIPIECGDGIKLQVADKITEQGNIMLAICVNETVSLYLSEAQLLGSTGNAFLAQAADVIGTVNVLQGSFGSMNPESVVVLRGQVFFYCLIKGCFVRYSNAGLFPISDYGMKRVSHLFSQAYAEMTEEEIEELGSRPFVFGGVDPYHLEVYWSIPSTTEVPPKGYLPSYESPEPQIIYPFDIYDGVGKVLVFKTAQNRWATPHRYETEGFVDIRDYLFSAKNGAMYQHNYDNGTDDTYSKWYGEEVKPEIGFIVNDEPNIVKQFLTLSVEGNIQPTFCIALVEYPNEQITDITDEWVTREGVFYAKLLRDKLSPNVSGTYDEKLYTGDRLRSNWMKVYVEFDTRELLQVRFFNAGAFPDAGHKT